MGTDVLERTAHGTLLYLEERPLDTRYGAFRAHIFSNLANGQFAVALLCGEVTDGEPLLARVHSSCVTSETFGACDCDCAGQLDEALRAIAAAGRGAVFYLMQEGRGAGFVAKARDRMIVQASRHRVTTFEAYERMGLGSDQRRYNEVAFACRILGIDAPLRLMTNNPEKVAALESEKLIVESIVPLREDASPYNLHYLASKSRWGHTLEDESDEHCPAELPEEVVYFDPHPLPSHPRFLRVAAYLLPIRLGGVAARTPNAEVEAPFWFWLHLYFDRAMRQERVVFTYRQDPQAQPLTRVMRESLLERFPVREGRNTTSEWRDVAAEIAHRGAGCAAFLPLELARDSELKRVRPDAATGLLIEHHLDAFAAA